MSLDFLRVGSIYLREGEKRLDAGYYALAVRARWELEQSGWPLKPLGQVAFFVYIGRFKRHYVPRSQNAVPFVGAREVFFWPLKSDKFLHPESVWDELFPSLGDILISCSGSIGYSLLAGHSLKNVAVSQHVLRIRAKGGAKQGYLYAFLRSSYGFNFMQGVQYGAVIKEIDPAVLNHMPVPILPERVQERIHVKMVRSLALRERGACLLKKAERLLYELLGLPDPETIKPGYLPNPSGTKVRAFAIKRSELEGRLDGSYHLPEVESFLQALKTGKYPLTPLEDLTEYIRIPPRFKRHYVDPDKGIPFVRPSDLATVRVLERRYIAKWTPELSELKLNRDEVLVSTDGSIGDMGYVTDTWDGWAGSNNIGRIKAHPERAHPGYLYAFLASPYGQAQIQREIYGGVIDHLEVEHLAGIAIPKPPLEIQETIGKRVLQAFSLRDRANALEEEAVAELEKWITEGPVLRLA